MPTSSIVTSCYVMPWEEIGRKEGKEGGREELKTINGIDDNRRYIDS